MTKFILLLICLYQKTLSPDHSAFAAGGFRRCRFYPSCSGYAAASFSQYGLFKGFVFSLLRVLRCNPFSRGGYDPVINLKVKSQKAKFQIKNSKFSPGETPNF